LDSRCQRVSLSPPLLVSLSIQMELLAQFLLRLAFGLAVGMSITSPQKVASGFFRNHLYVTLGLTTLSALVLWQLYGGAAVFAAIAAICSFVGAACWLYEAKWVGMKLIWAVALSSLLAAVSAQMIAKETVISPNMPSATAVLISLKTLDDFRLASIVTSGLVLGITFAAMLLGHWYLNAPGMELAPLRRLLGAAAVSIVAQAIVVGAGLVMELSHRGAVRLDWLLFVVLRWSFGICGVLALLGMAWRTLKIPNTQSATGILYVAVIGVFVGELTGLLLSSESAYPL
jgi:hypothetical protein